MYGRLRNFAVSIILGEVRRVNTKDVTYSNCVMACARAEASCFVKLTPPIYYTYNQIVNDLNTAKGIVGRYHWAYPSAWCVMPFSCI